MIQPKIQYNTSGFTMEPNISGISYSRAFYHNSGFTSTGYIMSPNQHILSQCDINNVVKIKNPSSIQCSGTFFSSHFEPIAFTPQYVTPLQEPNNFQIPTRIYITQPSPLPDDLSIVYPMKKLMNLDGREFEVYLKKLFEYIGYKVELTPQTRDVGCDLILTLGLETTVVQAKNQKKKVGNEGIQQVYTAKGLRKATHCLIITTGEFTRDALKDAQALQVEC